MKPILDLIWRSLIFVIWTTSFCFLPPKVFANNTVVLLYHKFGDNRTPSTNVSLDAFKAQMLYLKTHHYQVIPLKRLIMALEKKQPLPPKAVVITIDDGYKSVLKAFPILKEFGYPFTVFLPTEAIERHFPAYISWEEVKLMQKAGVDFQDHSYAHYRLGFMPKGMTENAYRNWIKKDLKKSRFIFKSRLGYEPDYLAFPYGCYNKILIEEALKLGYKALLTQDPGVVSEDTPLSLIPREAIVGKEWATMEHFTQILHRVDLPLLQHRPDIGFLKQNPPFEISGILKYPQRYLPGSFHIYVSEWGWQKAQLDAKTGKVFIRHLPGLKRKVNRIAITAIERRSGKPAVNFWMVILP